MFNWIVLIVQLVSFCLLYQIYYTKYQIYKKTTISDIKSVMKIILLNVVWIGCELTMPDMVMNIFQSLIFLILQAEIVSLLKVNNGLYCTEFKSDKGR